MNRMIDYDGDFYEDDEPIEELEAAFEQGEKRLTKRPAACGYNATAVVPGTHVGILRGDTDAGRRGAAA